MPIESRPTSCTVRRAGGVLRGGWIRAAPDTGSRGGLPVAVAEAAHRVQRRAVCAKTRVGSP